MKDALKFKFPRKPKLNYSRRPVLKSLTKGAIPLTKGVIDTIIGLSLLGVTAGVVSSAFKK